MKTENYEYPIDLAWDQQTIVQAIALCTAAEQAYEQGISSAEFMDKYRQFQNSVPMKMHQRQFIADFKAVSGYDIYQVFKTAQQTPSKRIKMRIS